eukprot:1161712-Pelagomonas_calceolata.AAC.6
MMVEILEMRHWRFAVDGFKNCQQSKNQMLQVQLIAAYIATVMEGRNSMPHSFCKMYGGE